MKAMIGALCILFTMAATVGSQTTSQTRADLNAGHGSISGRVTVDGQGAYDMVVMLTTADQGSNAKVLATTRADAEGRFQMEDVAAGRYTISGFAPAYTSDSNRPLLVILSDGQHVEGIEINLVRGGVITGRLLDSDKQPVVGQEVEAIRAVNADNQDWSPRRRVITSDDRGVYRIYGLAPARYLVRAGVDIANTSGTSRPKVLPLTFHPGVSDRNKAAIVRVESGSEVAGIDIVFGQPETLNLFEARGRVVEAETGRAVPGARIGYGPVRQNGSSWGSGGISDAEGYFKVGGLKPGRFYVSAELDGANGYCRPAEFEIKDRDVSDLKLRFQKGATIAGIVQAGEGVDRGILSRLQLLAMVGVSGGNESGHSGSLRFAPVSPEGAFQVIGLPAGEIRIQLMVPQDLRGLVISRIDHPMVQMAFPETREPEGAVTLQPGDQISGIRIIVKRLTGGIRGAIKLVGGNLTLGADLKVTLWSPSGADGSQSGTQVAVDPNGRFEVFGLPAGQYRITVEMILPMTKSRRSPSVRAEKTVTVGSDVEEIEVAIAVTRDP